MSDAKAKGRPAREGSLKPGEGNLPGFDYAERVGLAWGRAMTSQGAIANDAWNRIKTGSFKYSTMMQTWARLMESYFDVFVEATRGPGYVRGSVWWYFTFSKSKPSALEATISLPRAESQVTNLDPTVFAPMEGGQERGIDDAYTTCDWADLNRSLITIRLDTDKVKSADEGQYIGFILAKDRGPEPPLVIVMLRVTA